MKPYLVAIIVILVGGGAFYGGMQYQKSTDASSAASRAAAFGNRRPGGTPGNFGGRNGGNLVMGSILSNDTAKGILTIQMRDGSSKLVFYTTSTSIGKTTNGSTNDLANNQNVLVTGTTNADGSVTAQMIQLRPVMPQGQPGQGQMPANGQN